MFRNWRMKLIGLGFGLSALTGSSIYGPVRVLADDTTARDELPAGWRREPTKDERGKIIGVRILDAAGTPRKVVTFDKPLSQRQYDEGVYRRTKGVTEYDAAGKPTREVTYEYGVRLLGPGPHGTVDVLISQTVRTFHPGSTQIKDEVWTAFDAHLRPAENTYQQFDASGRSTGFARGTWSYNVNGTGVFTPTSTPAPTPAPGLPDETAPDGKISEARKAELLAYQAAFRKKWEEMRVLYGEGKALSEALENVGGRRLRDLVEKAWSDSLYVDWSAASNRVYALHADDIAAVLDGRLADAEFIRRSEAFGRAHTLLHQHFAERVRGLGEYGALCMQGLAGGAARVRIDADKERVDQANRRTLSKIRAVIESFESLSRRG